MFTAAQLLSGSEPTSRLLHGEPVEISQGVRGPIAIFPPGRLVAYLLERPRHVRLFLFRTCLDRATHLSEIPGVHPAVNLLLVARRRPTVKKVSKVFGLLTKHSGDIDELSDRFWLRVAGVISRRSPVSHATLAHLLAQEP